MTYPQATYLIRKYEGFSPIPYRCPAGYWTVGYGHVLQPGERYDAPISEEYAIQLLMKDIHHAEQAVSRLIPAQLTPGQRAALISFVFNVGGGALQRSTLRRRAARGEHLEAAEEFPKWVWARGKKLPGLMKRRAEERKVYLLDS